MEDLRKLLKTGRVIEINSCYAKQIGVIDCNLLVSTINGGYSTNSYNENLTSTIDSSCDITKVYENTPDGLKIIWDRKDFVDWSKVPVDTKVLVKDYYGNCFKRYFAKYEDGKIYTWDDGITSWSANSNDDIDSGWVCVKLAD